MKKLFFITLLFCYGITKAQNTAIPDPNFEQALINLGYDTGTPDGFVPTASIDTVTILSLSSYVTNYGISDFSGIQDFTALQRLFCSFNYLTSLDLSQNFALTFLGCDYNQLTSLTLPQNTVLTTLDCTGNQLTILDVTQNIALNELSCDNNHLTNLDVTQNTALTYLKCDYNQLTNLDVTQNAALTYLKCDHNQLTNLDVTQNTVLQNFYCQDNQINSLNLSHDNALHNLICFNNQLSCLNVKNGFNYNFLSYNFNTTNNPNLTCIEVDDTAYSNANWTYIDPQTSFSTNCEDACSTVGFEELTLSSISIYPNPTSGIITISLEEGTAKAISIKNNLGQIMPSEKHSSTKQLKLDISAYPNGIYFLQIETNKGIITKKIIKN